MFLFFFFIAPYLISHTSRYFSFLAYFLFGLLATVGGNVYKKRAKKKKKRGSCLHEKRKDLGQRNSEPQHQSGGSGKNTTTSDPFSFLFQQSYRQHWCHHDHIDTWVVATDFQDEGQGGDAPKEEWWDAGQQNL